MCATPPNESRNYYLEKQIRGAKDKNVQIPCRAGDHPCSRWVPGYGPAAGAALAGCGGTGREAAGAVTAGVVVAHRAKIHVIEMRERGGKKQKKKTVPLKSHWVLTDIPPFLPFYSVLPCTPHSSITHTHPLHSPGMGTHTRSGDLHLAVPLLLLQSLCIRD